MPTENTVSTKEQLKKKVSELEAEALKTSGKIGHGPNVWIKTNLKAAKNALLNIVEDKGILKDKEYSETELKSLLEDLNKIKIVNTKVETPSIADRSYKG